MRTLMVKPMNPEGLFTKSLRQYREDKCEFLEVDRPAVPRTQGTLETFRIW